MYSFLKTILKRKSDIGHAIIIVILINISIYSVYKVLYSYLNENKTVALEAKFAKDGSPFIDYVGIVIDFDQSTVFPQVWAKGNETKWPTYGQAMKRLANRINQASFYGNSTDQKTLSLESLIDITSIACYIRFYDECVWLSPFSIEDGGCIFEQHFDKCTYANITANDEWDKLKSDDQSIIPALNAFVNNSYGEKFLDQISNMLLTMYDKENRTLTDGPGESIIMDDLLLNSYIIYAPRIVLESPNALSLVPEFKNLPPFKLSMLMAQYSLTTPFGYDDPWTSAAGRLTMEIQVKNWGIFDSRPLKSEEECEKCEGLTDVEDCDTKCRLDALIDTCGCIPFSYRRLFKSVKEKRNLGFCTISQYKECRNKSNYGIWLTEYIMKEPCVLKMNNNKYQVEGKEYAGEGYMLSVSIKKQNQTYVVYTSQQQTSLMEMFGSLGGNLGMFLGFSFWGFWQFAIFLYSIYMRQRTKEEIKNDHIKAKTQDLVFSWFSIAASQARVGENKNSEETDGEKAEVTKADLEMLMKQNEKLQKNVDELYRMIGKKVDISESNL